MIINVKNKFNTFFEFLSNNKIYHNYFDENSKNKAYDILNNLIITNVEPNFLFEIPLCKKEGFDFGLFYNTHDIYKKNISINDNNVSTNDINTIKYFINNKDTIDMSTFLGLGYDLTDKNYNQKFNLYFLKKIMPPIAEIEHFLYDIINILKLNNMSKIIISQFSKTLPNIMPWYIIKHNARNNENIRLGYSYFNNKKSNINILECVKLIGYKYFTNEMQKQLNTILNLETSFEIQIDIDNNGNIGNIFSICVFLKNNPENTLINLNKLYSNYNIFNNMIYDGINKPICFKKLIFDETDMIFKWSLYNIIPNCIKIRWDKGIIQSFKSYITCITQYNS